MQEIDYFFYSSSPFTYLGHQPIQDVAHKHGCKLNVRPVILKDLWADSGAVPPAQRPLVRQRMRLIELQRLALHRGVPLNPKPQFHPVDATLADTTIVAVMEMGKDPFPYMADVFAAVWVKDLNIADPETISHILKQHDYDADHVFSIANEERIMAIIKENTRLAKLAGAPGVPAYALNGECFWGQDRITFLDEALTTGRSPITG